MPLPAMAFVPFFASFLGTAFSTLVVFFTKFFSRRFALAFAMIALIVALTVSFIAVLEGFVSLIEYAAPSYITIAISLFLPSNFKACISVAAGAKLTAWAYSWNVKMIQYKFDF